MEWAVGSQFPLRVNVNVLAMFTADLPCWLAVSLGIARDFIRVENGAHKIPHVDIVLFFEQVRLKTIINLFFTLPNNYYVLYHSKQNFKIGLISSNLLKQITDVLNCFFCYSSSYSLTLEMARLERTNSSIKLRWSGIKGCIVICVLHLDVTRQRFLLLVLLLFFLCFFIPRFLG